MNYWRDFWWSMQVSFYMQCIDSTTFMNWRETGIAGVPNIAGC